MKKEILIGLGAGFVVGSLFGFLWSQSTKKSIADNVKTDFTSGVMTVQVDTKKAAAQGLYNLLD